MPGSIIKNKYAVKCIVLIFWLLAWQVVSMAVSSAILFPEPLVVFSRLFELSVRLDFWVTVLSSLGKILAGLLLAVFVGVALSVFSAVSLVFLSFISPLITAIKSVPVASFTIIALIWFKSAYLSTFISFLMVLPIIYFNTLSGIQNVDPLLLEMAKVFRVPLIRKATSVYIPQAAPYFLSAISIGLGFAWKSGIAAEVIGLPKNSIGINMYNAKLYLETADLFAWTIVIVVMSMAVERFFLLAIKRWVKL